MRGVGDDAIPLMVWRGTATRQTPIFGQTLRDAALLPAYGVARTLMMPEASYPPRSLSANKKSGVAAAGGFVRGSYSLSELNIVSSPQPVSKFLLPFYRLLSGSCPKLPETAQYCPILPNTAQFCPVLPKCAQFCPKLTSSEMA